MNSPSAQDPLRESKRRRFFQVAAWYVVAAWAAIQVATSTFPYLGLPASLVTAVIVIALVGFPIALVVAWLQARADPDATHVRQHRRGGVIATAAFIIVALAGGGLWYFNRHRSESSNEAAFTTATLSQLTSSPEVEEFPAYSPDGKRLVYSRENGGYKQLFARDVNSGEETQLMRDSVDKIQPSWSPDGRWLLYVRANDATPRLDQAEVLGMYIGGDVWRLEVATNRAQKIIDNAYNPAYSADGTHIAFEASYVGPRRIWVADAAGRNPRQITTDASEAVHHILPRWSPDGRLLAYQNIEKTKLDIHVVDVASGKITKLTDDLVRDADPVWLPSSRDVLFSSARGGGWNLWRVAVNADGTPASAPRQVTTGAGQDMQAAPAADGKSVAFVTLNQNADLWLLPVDPATGTATGAATELIATTREDSRAAWSPDGKLVAFNSDRTGDMNVFVYSIADRATRPLTKGAGGDYQASWSPDGKRLVFFSSRSGSADIWTVDVADGVLHQLTRDAALDVNPTYSPDGKLIAFQSDRGGRREVWLMNADGSNQRQLTSTGVNDHFMLFSSDGATLYYHGTGPQVMQVNTATGEASLFKEIKSGAHVSFSPDHARIMDVVDHKTLWVTPLTSGAPQEVFAFPDPDVRIDYPRWSPDGRFVVFDRLKPTGGDIWMLKLK